MKEIDYSKIVKTGTSQENRFFKALDFDYVKVDEHSFEDLLVFAYGFSKLINFYNLTDQVDGDWSHFLNDETIILATIIDSDPNKVEIRFKNNLQKAMLFKNKRKKITYLKKCFEEIFGLAKRFESWLRKLKSVEDFTNSDVPIRTEVVNAVSSKLSGALDRLRSFELAMGQKSFLKENIGMDYSVFSTQWKVREEVAADKTMMAARNMGDSFSIIAEGLEQIFQEFYETLLYLKTKAPDYLSQSLKSDKHYPEMALFLAFLKLYKIVQGDINNLNKRHLEFYYSQILKQKPKTAVFDKLYLKFGLYDTALSAEVKKGTRFFAGLDEVGNDIVYRADYDLMVNKAKIEKLHTIYINNTPLNIKGVKKDLYSSILSASIPVEKEEFTEDDSGRALKTYATFGEDQVAMGEMEKTMAEATLGFAVASPNLLLSEGDRDISLTFQFSKDSFQKLQKYLADIASVNEADENETFIKIFMEAFNIKLTCDTGWHEIKKYVITRNKRKNALTVSFDVKSSEPAIVNFDRSLHEDRIDATFPVIKFILNDEGYVYPYSLLTSLLLDRILINTNVKGVKNLILHNNTGVLNADNPFYPFGPIPNVGSYLLVGSNEVFQKSLTDLNVNIEWFDLPKDKAGFKAYYQDYKLDLDNASFEVDLSVLNEGRWQPTQPGERQKFKLFRTSDKAGEISPRPDGTVKNKTKFNRVDIDLIRRKPNYHEINEDLTYNNMVQRGFIKLELIGPQFGFGHSVYPTVLSKTITDNAKITILKKKDKEAKMPNPAYTPLMKSISLDYSSSSVISFDRSKKQDESDIAGSMYHIHPFGENKIFPDNSKQHTSLIPEYEFEGSLIIGLAELTPPQTITILFEMHDEYTVSSEEDPPLVEWSYLVNNEWVALKPSKILSDYTKGFLRTGIITIELPHDIVNGNTILDPNLYWLRAVVYKNIEVASKTVSVTTQVLTATFDDVNNTALEGKHLDQPLPAGSVTRSADNIEGVQSVEQPLKSFEGLPTEKPKKFYTRVAERLRHKKRAISSWDYEHLILQKFHEVYKAACLPNMTSNNLDAPGSVLIVVTPYNTDMANPNEPMASSELLYKIKYYLQHHVSPFVKLEVRNPYYERLKIICSVKFKEGYNFGIFIQKLNDEIKRYISKSILAGDQRVDLGGKINTSDILSFMRTLPYVDFITKFSMIQTARDFNGKYVLLDTAKDGEPKSFLSATKPWSVLVSANEHQITVLNEKLEEKSRQAGINFLELGHDFIIE